LEVEEQVDQEEDQVDLVIKEFQEALQYFQQLQVQEAEEVEH
jgi:hypothetical protein